MPDIPILAIFGTSFLVGFSGAASPGPLLAYNIREAAQRGFIAGPVIGLGHGLLELVVVVLLALGLARMNESSLFVALVGIFGGAFLVWMGWGLLRRPEQGAPGGGSDGAETKPRSIVVPFFGSMAISLSNPFWTIWWITVGAAFMTKSLEAGVLGIAAFYVGHILSDIGWYSLVSAGIASGRRFITVRVYKGIMMACGTFIVFMGLYFLATSMARLG
ncbi:MAG: LysE family transporter [Chloroflexi bacterium]|nr:LysE family transporter [Chloroflexota bacterium]